MGIKLTPFGKKKTEEPGEKQIDVQVWTSRGDKGIYPEKIPESKKPTDVIEWNICGNKVLFVYKKDGGFYPVLQPQVDQPPEKLSRLYGCLPRQELQADVKDTWQKLATWAPVMVIGLGMVLLLVWTSPGG